MHRAGQIHSLTLTFHYHFDTLLGFIQQLDMTEGDHKNGLKAEDMSESSLLT